MKIYNYLGVELLDIEVDDKSYRYKELMSDNQLFLYFSLPYFVELPIGAYADFKAERYYLSDPENFKMNHTRDWEYTVVLDSYIALTKTTKFKFFTVIGGLAEGDFELKFSLTETAAEFARLFVQNMNHADPDGGWQVGDCIESEPITIDFNHTFCYDVLSELADKFKTEWEIEGKTLHIRKVEKEKESPISLTYGYDSGLIPGFQRSNAGKKKANRLYVETSERNIDCATYGRKTLGLLKSATVVHNGINYVTDASGSYIERQNRTGLILENSIDLTHIYPKRVGTVTNVITVNAEKHLYDIVDLGIENGLNYNDFLIAGETMTLIFQTGDLAGLEFDVKYIHADRRFELVPITETGVIYPADALLPAINDEYAVFHCSLPGIYITNAETEATNEAAAELYEQEQDKYTYNGTLDELYAKRHWLEIGGFLNVGYFVRLTLQDAISNPVDIRIVAVKDYVNKPQKPEITLSNEASGKQLGSALASVKNKEQAVNRMNNNTTRFARRGFREAMETAAMLQNSMLNFSGSINPITVQAMQYVAGDASLQFDFVANSSSKIPVAHVESYDPATKKFTSAAGVIMHKTLGIDTLSSSYPASAYKTWTMAAYISPVLDNANKSYYLYAKVSKTENTGVFLLSETAIAMEQVAGYYHLLMGLLNSEFDADRSYSPMYGYSEWSPGRFTIRKIVSPAGGVYFDLEKNDGQGEIGGFIKFRASDNSLKTVEQAIDEVEVGGANLIVQSNTPVSTTAYYLRSCVTSENIVTGKEYTLSIKGDVGRTYDIWVNWGSNRIGATTDKGNGLHTITFVAPAFVSGLEKLINVYRMSNADTSVASIQWVQLEKGNKATDWSPSSEDVAADATAKANAAQTAAQNYALAKAQLAEVTAKAHADGIVDAEEARAIADATAKAEAARVAAVNAAAVDATSKVNAIDIGDRNLVLDSLGTYSGINALKYYNLSEPLVIGQQYAISVKGDVGAGANFNVWINSDITHALNLPATGIAKGTFIYQGGANPSRISVFSENSANPSTVYWVKIAKGNKATSDWSPAPEDTQKVLDEMSSDNKLTAQEKSVALKEWQAIQGEYTRLSTLATQLGVTNTLSTPYTNLANYINPLLSSMTVTSDIVGSTFRSYFTAYYNASTDLQNALTSKVQSNVTNLKPAGKNYLIGSRTDSLVGWGAYGGTMSVVTDAQYGKVVEYSRPAGGGDFMKVFSIDTSELKNIELVYYCIAKPPTSGMAVFNFGGWSETFTMLNNNSPYRDLGNGWRMYYKVFTAGNAIASGTTFGLNSVGGTWRFHSFGVAKGNTPPADWDASPKEIDFLKQGYQASTDIEGGVVQTAVLLLRNLAEQITAGMSGLGDDNIGMWAGGTYQEALNSIAKIILRKDGSGQLAGGNITWDAAGALELLGKITAGSGKIGGLDIFSNSLKSASMSFSETPVESLASLITPATVPLGFHYTQNASANNTTAIAYTNNFAIPWDAKIKFRATTGWGVSWPTTEKGKWTVLVKQVGGSTVFSQTGNDVISNQLFEVSVPAGTYIIEVQSRSVTPIPLGESTTASAYITGESSSTIYAYGYNFQTKIGNNGFYSFWDALKFLYYNPDTGLVVRGATDIPAGLGGASINSSGTVVSVWGKITSTGQVVKSGSNYTITHNIGDTDYSLILTPKSANVPYFLDANRLANTIVVTCAGGFDFVLIRTK
ncbi:MAG: hypothetical protein EOM47_06485 [Bacteroidia bacterium]|nr:hypothetical protein [Bacteroidia bacterium]